MMTSAGHSLEPSNPAPQTLPAFFRRVVAWSTAPLLLLALLLAVDDFVDTRERFDAEAQAIARRVAFAADLTLEARIDGLELLASSPLAADLQPLEAFYERAQQFLRAYGSHVVLADAALNPRLNTRVALGDPLPPLPRPRGRAAAPDALRTLKPAVGDVVTGPIAGEPVMALAVPVVRGGKAVGVLMTVLEARTFERQLASVVLPERWRVVLRDSLGTPIAGRGDAVSDDARGFEHALQGAAWSVVVEVPDGMYQRALMVVALTLALAVLSALGAAGAAGWRASRPLLRSIRALAGGEPAPAGHRFAEVDDVRRRLADAEAERERSQQALRDTARHYQLLFERNPQPMWVYDQDTLRFVEVNRRAVESYGYTREQFLGMTLLDIRPPQEAERTRAFIEQRRAEAARGVTGAGVWTHRRSDGGDFPVEISSSDLQLQGRDVRLVMATDITHRVSLEHEAAALLAQATRARDELAEVLARIGDGFVAFDGDWRFSYVNPRAAALLHLPEPGTLPGRVVHDALPGVERRPWFGCCAEARAAQQPRVELVFDDEWQSWLELRAFPSPAGLSVYVADVTERRRAEQALRDSERDFRLLAEQIPGIVYRTRLGAGGQVEYVSPRIAELGYTPQQWIADAQAIWRTIHPDDRERVRAELRQALAEGRERLHLEYRMCLADGRLRHASDHVQVVRPPQGEPFVLGINLDVSDRVAAHEALRQSQQELSQLTRRLMEQERDTTARLAQRLHDRLGQALTSARLRLDALRGAHAAGWPAELRLDHERLGDELDEALTQVRDVLVELRPPLLAERGLATALQAECTQRLVAAGRTDIWFDAAPALLGARLPAEVEYALFMVAREALTNALRHAGAQLIQLRLDGDRQQLQLQIDDDGSGIDELLVNGRPGHLGIVGMRERARAIGAAFDVRRLDGGGTRVLLQWPA